MFESWCFVLQASGFGFWVYQLEVEDVEGHHARNRHPEQRGMREAVPVRHYLLFCSDSAVGFILFEAFRLVWFELSKLLLCLPWGVQSVACCIPSLECRVPETATQKSAGCEKLCLSATTCRGTSLTRKRPLP